MLPSRRTPTDPLSGLGAPFLGYARVELPVSLRPITIHPHLFFPPYHVRALKTCFSIPMSPPCPSPVPPKCTHLSENRVFFPLLLLLATVNSVERIAAASARFLSPRHEEERTNADVNTGNDTNTNQRKKAQKTKQLAWNEVEIAESFSRRENRQLR